MNDRKIINIFKTFIQKVFVPQLPKMESACQQQWYKFSTMIFAQQINLNQLQLYVDTLSNSASNNFINNISSNFTTMMNKQSGDKNQVKVPFLAKIRKGSNDQSGNSNFSLTRTFGDEKSRMMFPLKDFDQTQQQQTVERQNYSFSKDFSKDIQQTSPYLNTQQVVPVLQKIFKTLSENQIKMQKPGTITTYQTKLY